MVFMVAVRIFIAYLQENKEITAGTGILASMFSYHHILFIHLFPFSGVTQAGVYTDQP